ncbi:ankyrin repeat protein [Apiospora rasikravindrae]|uniref:Ankyrin repeat protein n=1 Tax=Apiospora rasikravindrae TaxID=990691 RepID=A0ABR1RXZ6_9PEZI
MSDISDLDEAKLAANRIYQLVKEDNVVGVREHLMDHPDIKKWIIIRPDGRIHHAPIPFAARVGSLEVLRVLMAAAGETDWVPSLYRACRNGQVEVARWILDHHVDAAAESLSSDGPHGSLLLSTLGSCPPHRLEAYPEVKVPGHVWRPRQEEVIHLLLDRGANLHDKRYRSTKRFTDDVELLVPGWDVPLDYSDQDALDELFARDGNNQGFNDKWENSGRDVPPQSMEPKEPTSRDVLVEPMEPTEETVLTLALSFGSGHLISRLIDDGCDIHVNVRQFQDTEEGEMTEDVTPLHLACHYRNIAGVRSLLQAGGSDAKSMIAARDSNGMTPFHWTTLDAALSYSQGDVWEDGQQAPSDKMKACLELLLACDSTQLDAQDRWGRTVLHYASILETADVAIFLVDRNADPNVRDEDGCTPLFTLVSCSYMPSIVNRHLSPDDLDLFFQHGAELQGADADGNTLLHLASRCWRWKDLVQWLLEHGVCADTTNGKKELPLHIAANCIHELSDGYGDTFVRFNNALTAQDEMMRMLAEAGAGNSDMDQPDAEGTTPRQALAACRKRANEAFGYAIFSRFFAECEELEHRQFRLGYKRLPAELQKMIEGETTVERGRVNTYHLRHNVSIGRGHANPTRGTGRFRKTWDNKPRRYARARGRSLEQGGSLYI